MHFGIISLTLCGNMTCLESCAGIYWETSDLISAYGKLSLEFRADRCDYCGLHHTGVRGHRCSRCLTKVYCGEQCRDQDWGVHKLVCREGEVGRKMKGGKQARKQKGIESYESVMAKFK